ncbi:MAG TPA: hypothetical protein VNL38_02960 [Candidatus Nitrosotenuis sp.]|nr:hypothetical protein [Candidatus Nitrosotenuis sp.]
MNERVKSGAGVLLKWLSGGAGAALVWLLWEALRANPQGLWAVLQSWGTGFGIAAVAIYVVDRRAGQLVSALNETAQAQRTLGGAVQQLVEKDDRDAQATNAAIGFVCQQNEKILASLETIEKRLPKT